jgi:hypothetical protein
MRLRRAVLQIPAKSSVPPRLPFHKNRSFPNPSQSTFTQLLIPLHFNSFSSNAYKKTRGRVSAAVPKVCQLVTYHMLPLRTQSNSRNPIAFIEVPHGSLDTRVGGVSLFSAYSVSSALKSPSQPASTSAGTRKPSSGASSLRVSANSASLRYLFCLEVESHRPLHFKVRFTRSLPGATNV